MEQNNKIKIKEIIAHRKKAHQFYKKNSTVYKSFVDMEEKAFRDGDLSKMTKELIAIGISVKIDCESCMEWHILQAKEAGATQKQVIEAIEIGIEMGGGPATVSSRFAMDVIEYYYEKQ